jgi:hypothetical protein
MAIIFKNTPVYATAGNPVHFELQSDSDNPVRYEVKLNGGTVYEGVCFPAGQDKTVIINLSEVARSYSREYEVIESDEVVKAVFTSFETFTVFFYQDEFSLNASVKIYPGGISKKIFRELAAAGSDFFQNKLQNPEKPNVFTTRTFGANMELKRTEIAPLYILACNEIYKIVADNGYTYQTNPLTVGNVYVLDITHENFSGSDTIRIFTEDDVLVFTLTVIAPDLVCRRLVVEFLNSLSAFERIEVTGKVVRKPEFAENEGYQVYDETVDDYLDVRDRFDVKETLTAEFGYKSYAEFMFIRDVLQSNRQFLITKNGQKTAVNITSEEFTHDLHPVTVGSISLKIEALESDTNYSPTDLDIEVIIPPVDTFSPTTDISLIFTTYGDNETITNAIHMRSNSIGGRARVQWEENGPMEDIEMGALEEGYSYVYPVSGNHTVRILAEEEIRDIRFSALQNPLDDYAYPQNTYYLTGVNYFRSTSMNELYYTFAGQQNLTSLADDFVFETPLVGIMQGTFFLCSNLANLPEYMLQQMPNIVYLYWTFRNLKIAAISADFFANQINLVATVDLFRENHSLTSVATGLLRNCSKLFRLEGFFNYCDYLPAIPQTFLQGTIACELQFLCWLCTRFYPPVNLLQYAVNPVNLEGIYGQTLRSDADINDLFPSVYPTVEKTSNMLMGATTFDAFYTGDAAAFVAKFTKPPVATAGALRYCGALSNLADSTVLSWL